MELTGNETRTDMQIGNGSKSSAVKDFFEEVETFLTTVTYTATIYP